MRVRVVLRVFSMRGCVHIVQPQSPSGRSLLKAAVQARAERRDLHVEPGDTDAANPREDALRVRARRHDHEGEVPEARSLRAGPFVHGVRQHFVHRSLSPLCVCVGGRVNSKASRPKVVPGVVTPLVLRWL